MTLLFVLLIVSKLTLELIRFLQAKRSSKTFAARAFPAERSPVGCSALLKPEILPGEVRGMRGGGHLVTSGVLMVCSGNGEGGS